MWYIQIGFLYLTSNPKAKNIQFGVTYDKEYHQSLTLQNLKWGSFFGGIW